MRIANLMFGRGLGGIEQAFLDYNEALLMAGHEVLAITHPLAKINTDIEGELTCSTLNNLGSWDPTAGFRLSRMLKAFKPDATISHGNRALTLTHKAKRHAGLHVGVTHNYKLKHFKKLDVIFAITKDLQRTAVNAGSNLTHIARIPNMVRMPHYPVARIAKPNTQPVVIGAMGRMVEKKGFAHLIGAAAKLKVMTRLPFKIMIGGEGEELGALKKLIKKHKLQDIVELRGWVDDKAAFFAECDIFCLPSLHEPFGIVLLEAMAHGTPIVAYKSEGPSEIFMEHPDAGLLVPLGNIGALADTLSRLLPNQAQRDFLTQQSRAAVEQEFALAMVSKKIDTALKRFIHT
ncbi:MAG: glycosyltransferase [Rickettsiales bacterium]|nr:glycosyltransferase [Rickettsiales bacterium]